MFSDVPYLQPAPLFLPNSEPSREYYSCSYSPAPFSLQTRKASLTAKPTAANHIKYFISAMQVPDVGATSPRRHPPPRQRRGSAGRQGSPQFGRQTKNGADAADAALRGPQQSLIRNLPFPFPKLQGGLRLSYKNEMCCNSPSPHSCTPTPRRPSLGIATTTLTHKKSAPHFSAHASCSLFPVPATHPIRLPPPLPGTAPSRASKFLKYSNARETLLLLLPCALSAAPPREAPRRYRGAL